jgi:hypothetical protein
MTSALFANKILAAAATIIFWVTAATVATADETLATARFSGNIQIGAMWSDSTSQLKAVDSNETTDDIDGPADHFDVFYPVVLFDLKYRASDDTTLHAGTPIDEYGIRLSTGATHDLGPAGQLDVSVFWSPMHREWKDPYIAGQERDETDVLDVGVELNYNRIMGSAWQCRARYHYIDLDQDLIGERYEDLQRDGTRYTINLGYALPIGRSDRIVPAVDYTHAPMEGASNSYDSYRFILNYVHRARRYMLNAYLGGGISQYAKEHPLYGKTRREKSVGGFAILTWFNPFTWQHTFFSVGLGAGYADANIDFFDARTYSTLASFGYSF